MKIEQEQPPAALTGTVPQADQPGAEGDAPGGAGGVDAENRAEVKFPGVRIPPVGHRAPEQGPARFDGALAVIAVEGKQRSVELADRVVVREKNLQRAEDLQLLAAHTIVPRTEQRPEMGFVRGRGVGIGQAALVERPVEKEKQL